MLTQEYSSNKLSRKLLAELEAALKSVKAYGSVEIFVQNNIVTQITVRSIKKTSSLKPNGASKLDKNKKMITK